MCAFIYDSWSSIDHESIQMAAKSAAGYSVPPGVDPRKQESVEAWIDSFGSEAMGITIVCLGDAAGDFSAIF